MAEIKEIRPGIMEVVPGDVVIPPDQILEHNKGRFAKIFIVGIGPDDGSENSEELILVASHSIMEMYVHLGVAMREIEDIATGKK